jgi:hypothetical protein
MQPAKPVQTTATGREQMQPRNHEITKTHEEEKYDLFFVRLLAASA